MKQKLLALTLLTLTLSFANPKSRTAINPSIGIMMSAMNTGNEIVFNISIKNIGEETLTNINVFEANPVNGITFNFSTIASMAPGEEVTNLIAYKIGSYCFFQSQVMVNATAASTNYPITDLSSDPNYYDNFYGQGTYYNDFFTYSNSFFYANGQQDGTYVDANNNSIVDVGDVINYTYNVYNSSGMACEIFDNNAIIDNSFFPFGSGFTTGIHYITAAEVALGYVYNTSNVIGYGQCDLGTSLYDASYCACPNPDSANIVTPLTSDLPNQISGKVKFNSANDNCTTGLNFPNRRVNTTDGTYTYSTYSDTTGDYHILIPNTGNYTTTALTNLNANFTSNPASVATTSSGTGVDYNNTTPTYRYLCLMSIRPYLAM
jgi:hypothetical protein